MGKRPMFRFLYTQSLMQYANNIHHSIRTLELTIDELIDMSGNGISVEQVFCGYEDLSKVEDNWEFEKEVSSPNQIASLQTIVSLWHSQSFENAMNKIMASLVNIVM